MTTTNQISLPVPYPAQQRLLAQAKRNNLFILSRRWGKTTLVSRILHHKCLTIPKYRAAFSAPTWKLMLETFENYIKVLNPAIARLSRADHRIELINDSVIELWSSQDVSAGRSRRYHLWVSDETQRQKNLAKFIRGSVRPTLADFRGDLFILATANGEGSELHDFYLDCMRDPNWFIGTGKLEDNPYIHPDEIAQLRIDLGPDVAAQELDSLWIRISGKTPFIRQQLWDELIGELPSTDYVPTRTLAIDASINSDQTAIVGVCTRDEIVYVPAADIQVFEPTLDGETDFAAIERYLLERWSTGQYSRVCYDPYQMVAVAQSLRSKGVRMQPVTQNAERIKADTYLRQLATERRLRHPDDPRLNEHVLNGVLRFSNGLSSQFRIVKPAPEKKIDLLVALSMAAWIHKTMGGNSQPYRPVTALTRPTTAILPVHDNPLQTSDIYNPWKGN